MSLSAKVCLIVLQTVVISIFKVCILLPLIVSSMINLELELVVFYQNSICNKFSNLSCMSDFLRTLLMYHFILFTCKMSSIRGLSANLTLGSMVLLLSDLCFRREVFVTKIMVSFMSFHLLLMFFWLEVSSWFKPISRGPRQYSSTKSLNLVQSSEVARLKFHRDWILLLTFFHLLKFLWAVQLVTSKIQDDFK